MGRDRDLLPGQMDTRDRDQDLEKGRPVLINRVKVDIDYKIEIYTPAYFWCGCVESPTIIIILISLVLINI